MKSINHPFKGFPLISFFVVLMLFPVITLAQRPAKQLTYQKVPTSLLPGVTERDFAIYLPPSYTTQLTKRYPVLYLLHGGGGSYVDWPVQARLESIANDIINSGNASEMIIVCPDSKHPTLNNTMWFNMDNWPFEDHFFKELIPFIDKNYRTLADGHHRAVAGLSMGGGGTIVYATSHTDMFCAAYALSSYIEPVSFADKGNEWLQKEVENHNGIRLFDTATPEQVAKWKAIKWFFDFGDDDFTYEMNIAMIAAVRKQQIPYQLRVRDGGHTWQYWTNGLYTMLPFVSTAFNGE